MALILMLVLLALVMLRQHNKLRAKLPSAVLCLWGCFIGLCRISYHDVRELYKVQVDAGVAYEA